VRRATLFLLACLLFAWQTRVRFAALVDDASRVAWRAHEPCAPVFRHVAVLLGDGDGEEDLLLWRPRYNRDTLAVEVWRSRGSSLCPRKEVGLWQKRVNVTHGLLKRRTLTLEGKSAVCVQQLADYFQSGKC
jgi:hypothetical protein